MRRKRASLELADTSAYTVFLPVWRNPCPWKPENCCVFWPARAAWAGSKPWKKVVKPLVYPVREDIPIMLDEEAKDRPTWDAGHPQAVERG